MVQSCSVKIDGESIQVDPKLLLKSTFIDSFKWYDWSQNLNIQIWVMQSTISTVRVIRTHERAKEICIGGCDLDWLWGTWYYAWSLTHRVEQNAECAGWRLKAAYIPWPRGPAFNSLCDTCEQHMQKLCEANYHWSPLCIWWLVSRALAWVLFQNQVRTFLTHIP